MAKRKKSRAVVISAAPKRARAEVRLTKPAGKCVKRREIWYGAMELGLGLGNVFRTRAMAEACTRGPGAEVVEVLMEYWVPGSLGKT